MLAEIVRLNGAHHRPVAGDSDQVEGLKLVARTHQSLIWDRTRHLQRLRQALREYFPAALEALAAGKLELADGDALELLGRAGDPDRAARLSRSKIAAVLKRGRRRDPEAPIASTQSQLLTGLNNQIPELEEVVAEGFGQHPDAEIYTSQPGLGTVLGARVLAEFGDDPAPLPRSQSPAATTPGHPRSPAPPGARPWCSPATPATAVSATQPINGSSAP